METQKTWLEEEEAKLAKPKNYEELPSLKLTPNVIAELEIDFSKPFEEWKGESQNGKPVTKKILPVIVSGTRMNWWLNIQNPVYPEIIRAGRTGQTKFKILQTGTAQNTKYVLVK